MLLNQSRACWKDCRKGQEKAADPRSELCPDYAHERGYYSTREEPRGVLLPGGLTDAGKIYGDFAHVLASQMNQILNAAATHTTTEIPLATNP